MAEETKGMTLAQAGGEPESATSNDEQSLQTNWRRELVATKACRSGFPPGRHAFVFPAGRRSKSIVSFAPGAGAEEEATWQGCSRRGKRKSPSNWRRPKSADLRAY
ncbi:UNVERIFIED_ORG: hypothetical protein J2X79_003485 [Arthrobacter globiformis]|nr:hypothetical protein [Arthrobacter globiformis]